MQKEENIEDLKLDPSSILSNDIMLHVFNFFKPDLTTLNKTSCVNRKWRYLSYQWLEQLPLIISDAHKELELIGIKIELSQLMVTSKNAPLKGNQLQSYNNQINLMLRATINPIIEDFKFTEEANGHSRQFDIFLKLLPIVISLDTETLLLMIKLVKEKQFLLNNKKFINVLPQNLYKNLVAIIKRAPSTFEAVNNAVFKITHHNTQNFVNATLTLINNPFMADNFSAELDTHLNNLLKSLFQEAIISFGLAPSQVPYPLIACLGELSNIEINLNPEVKQLISETLVIHSILQNYEVFNSFAEKHKLYPLPVIEKNHAKKRTSEIQDNLENMSKGCCRII